MQDLELAGLRTRVVGDGPLTVVLLHGFGAPGDDLVGLAPALRAPVPVRFVFPQAPLGLPPMYGGGRAWWMLDLAKLEIELRAGAVRDRRAEIPEGLHEVRTQVSNLIDEVKTRFTVDDKALVLGGFSQGAMVSLDVALHRETPPAGVIAMSGTLIAEPEWQPRYAKLAGVPIVQSHGKSDPLLPFSVAETLRDALRGAGADVEWVPFAGGHEIPPVVISAATALLARVAQ